MLTLDDVRNLDPDEVTETDAAVLNEHKEELTDDEKIRYASFFAEPKSDEPQPTDDSKSQEPKEEIKEDPKNTEPAFDQEKIGQMINDAVQKAKEELKPKEEPKSDEQKFDLPDDWEPKNWQEAFEKAREFAEWKHSVMTSKAQKELDTINAALTAEIDELRESGEPIPAKGTKEYQEFDNKLTEFSLKYKLPSFKTAYALMKQIKEDPKDEPKNDPDEEPKNDEPKNSKNKEVAKKIGGSAIDTGRKGSEYKFVPGLTPRQTLDRLIDDIE